MLSYIIRDIPDKLWRAVKSKAAFQGKPVRTVILELLTKYAE
jgi:predicted DNA binding CopG/RHH family protein